MAQKFDVCIRGDGMVGRTLALLLARQRLRVGLVSHATQATDHHKDDVRAYSLNSASRDLLSSLRCWPDALHATPVQHMRVWGDDGGFAHFESPTPEGLTWIVDVPTLEAQLAEAVRYQAEITRLDAPAPAALTVVCEGRRSSTRDELGVNFEVLPYQQHAVAARVRGSIAHRQQALQWFAHHGKGLEILALLPLSDPHASAVVWSLPPQLAQQRRAIDAQTLCAELARSSADADGQQFLLPLIFLVSFGIFAGIYAIYYPNTTLANVMTYLPFSSPVLAFITLAKGAGVSAYTTVLLSLVVLLASALLLLKLAGRWYKNSILKF